MCGSEYKALVDTGASISLISKKLVDENELKPCRKKVLDASGNYIPIVGEVNTTVVTPGGSFRERFLVCNENKKLKLDILLGMNVLHRAVLNFPDGTIKFKDIKQLKKDEGYDAIKLKISTIKFSNDYQPVLNSLDNAEELREEEGVIESDEKCFAMHLRENIELKENSVMVMKIKAPTKLKDSETIVIHNTEHSKKRILVGSAVSTIKEGNVFVQLINLNDKTVVMKQGSFLCQANIL